MNAEKLELFTSSVVESPEVFLKPSEELIQQTTEFTKMLFDYAKQTEPIKLGAMDELYTDGFEAEQIWEQIKMQSAPVSSFISKSIKKLTSSPSDVRVFHEEQEAGEEVAQVNEAGSGEESEEENSGSEDDDEHDDEGDLEGEQSSKDEDDSEVEERESADEDESNEGHAKSSTNSNHAKAMVVKKKTKTKTTTKKDDIEDGFFNWDDMERDAAIDENSDSDSDENIKGGSSDEEEEEEEEDEDDDEDEDDEDGAEIRYEDFFGPKPGSGDRKRKHREEEGHKGDESDVEDDESDDGSEDNHNDSDAQDERREGKRGRELLSDEDGAENNENVDEEEQAERGIQSNFQRQQRKIREQIEEYEGQAIKDKSWELRGEVKSSSRPENSLLEATLDYERTTKVAPTITPEITANLEDIIKQRILEDNFDDVVRKLAPTEEEEKEVELSQEKSKQSLGEIYEQEFMKTSLGFEQDGPSKKDQEEIQVMFDRLSWKLNALSNFQFTPKPVVKEMEVKPAVPAIAMEEAIPMAVSDANLLAPEEVYRKKKGRDGVVQESKEMSQAERNAKRNAKKKARRKTRQQKEADERLVAKINPGMGNKYEKKKVMESLQASNVTKGKVDESDTTRYSKSSQFFKNLQDDVSRSIQAKSATTSTSSTPKEKSAASYKL